MALLFVVARWPPRISKPRPACAGVDILSARCSHSTGRCHITFDPATRCYGFSTRLPGLRPHWTIDTFTSLEDVMRWVDPWTERVWEEPDDADESRTAGTNIKIMEAMAMGKAIVTTPGGINGLGLDSGQDLMVTATGPAMAEAILELFENPAQRQSLERQARRRAESDFDWDLIATSISPNPVWK